MKKLSLLCFVIFLVIVSQAIGDNWWWSPSNVEIDPAIPTTYDVVAITIGGWWGSSCIPRDSAISSVGSNIYFDVIWDYPPGIVCATVMSQWARTESIGPLSLGTYTVYARLLGVPHIPETYTPVAEFNVTDKQFVLSPRYLTVSEGQTATFTVALLDNPCETVEVIVSHLSGDTDIAVQSGEVLIFNSSNYSNPQTVTLMAAEDEDYFNGEAVILITTPGFIPAQVNAIESDNYYVPPILYVCADAPGANNGASWTDAFTDLQEALDLASYVSVVEEVRVAQGFYTPAEPGGNDGATFQLISAVAIKGGYAGFGEPDPNARDINAYETILSGDLNDNYGPNFTNNDENSRHVVTGSGSDPTAVLDGFTVTAGKGGGSGSNGGGMYNSGNSTVINCTFIDNSAAYGGGIVCTNGSSLTAINCTFSRNSVSWYGGAIESWNADSLTLTNCIFRGNSAGEGGGVYSFNTNCTLINCIFSGNSAIGGYRKQGYGGGIYIKDPPFEDKTTIIANCTFIGNSGVAEAGAGICLFDIPIFTNCILWGNRDSSGTGWSAQIYTVFEDQINYSCIQGWTGALGGTGNIGDDPAFADPNGPDGIVGTEDDNLRLLPGSPCIDAGDNSVVDPNSTDLDGNDRILDGDGDGIAVVDMGAYEFFYPNSPPIADTGEDQIVYACVDEIAEVKLDGSGSFDSDGDELEYFWFESDVQIATGVDPNVELTIGEHIIELVVDDGTESSEPNEVIITVIGPIEADVHIVPRVINRRSRMKRVMAIIRLPEGIGKHDIDDEPFVLEPGGIESRWDRVIGRGNQATVFALFDKNEVMDALSNNGGVELTVIGKLESGQCISGTDTVRIVQPRRRRTRVLRRR